MKKAVEKYEGLETLPFTMRFMEIPEVTDRLDTNGNTLTTVYTTDSGPSSSPDDGPITKKDD